MKSGIYFRLLGPNLTFKTRRRKNNAINIIKFDWNFFLIAAILINYVVNLKLMNLGLRNKFKR